MNDDDGFDLRPGEFWWRSVKRHRTDVVIISVGPISLASAIGALLVIGLVGIVPGTFVIAHPWLLAIPILVPVITVPMQHVRIDRRGTRVQKRWGLFRAGKAGLEFLSCPIVAQYHASSVYRDAGMRVEIGDIVLDVQRSGELAAWLEARRRELVNSDVVHGPYR